MKEMADKIDASQKERINTAVEELKNAVKGEDKQEIESKMDVLTGTLHEISKDLYQKTAASGEPKEPPTGEPKEEERKKKGPGDEDIIDADYKVKE